MNTAHIGILAFPGVLQLDLTGPYGVLASGPASSVDVIWKDTLPVISSDKLILTPTLTIDACPPLDVICVPGGSGIVPLLRDAAILDFLRLQARTACYIASICTGALILGAADLLRGYKATTHWQSWDMLAEFGAIPVKQRVVIDRNRMSAAGVSAGIDMALTLAALLWNESTAQEIQLNMEYAPEPPFGSGSPDTAPPAITAALRAKNTARQAERLAVVREVMANMTHQVMTS